MIQGPGATTTVGVSWWSIPEGQLLGDLGSDRAGLDPAEAASRLSRVGPNVVRPREEVTRWRILVKQIRSPLVLILVFAAVVSGVVSEWLDAIITADLATGRLEVHERTAWMLRATAS